MYSQRSPYDLIEMPYYMSRTIRNNQSSLQYTKSEHPLTNRQAVNMMRILDRYSSNSPSPMSSPRNVLPQISVPLPSPQSPLSPKSQFPSTIQFNHKPILKPLRLDDLPKRNVRVSFNPTISPQQRRIKLLEEELSDLKDQLNSLKKSNSIHNHQYPPPSFFFGSHSLRPNQIL